VSRRRTSHPGIWRGTVEELIGKWALTMLDRLLGSGVESPVYGGPFADTFWLRGRAIWEIHHHNTLFTRVIFTRIFE
jgi:hypothetical protein